MIQVGAKVLISCVQQRSKDEVEIIGHAILLSLQYFNLRYEEIFGDGVGMKKRVIDFTFSQIDALASIPYLAIWGAAS